MGLGMSGRILYHCLGISESFSMIFMLFHFSDLLHFVYLVYSVYFVFSVMAPTGVIAYNLEPPDRRRRFPAMKQKSHGKHPMAFIYSVGHG